MGIGLSAKQLVRYQNVLPVGYIAMLSLIYSVIHFMRMIRPSFIDVRLTIRLHCLTVVKDCIRTVQRTHNPLLASKRLQPRSHSDQCHQSLCPWRPIEPSPRLLRVRRYHYHRL